MTAAERAWRFAAMIVVFGFMGALLMSSALPAETVWASWYQSGHRTANGERFRPDGMTCAHRTLPFGTVIEVHNLGNGRHARCRITDRGPFVRGRKLDVSRGVARKLGMLNQGVASVRIAIVR